MNERMQILNMLSEGKITVDEAHILLKAIESSSSEQQQAAIPKWLRIRVGENGKEKVKVNLPLSLARMGLAFLPESAMIQINAKGIDLKSLLNEDFSTPGKIVDFQEGNHTVEVFVE